MSAFYFYSGRRQHFSLAKIVNKHMANKIAETEDRFITLYNRPLTIPELANIFPRFNPNVEKKMNFVHEHILILDPQLGHPEIYNGIPVTVFRCDVSPFEIKKHRCIFLPRNLKLQKAQ